MPRVVWIMPALGVGIFLASIGIVTSKVPDYMPYVCAAGIVVWAFYVWQLTATVRKATAGGYVPRPLHAFFQAIVGSPAAAAISAVALWGVSIGLDRLYYTIFDVLPYDLPIILSAQTLIGNYGLWIQLVLCAGMILSANHALTQPMRKLIATAENRKFSRWNWSGFVISLAFSVPSFMWLVRDTGFVEPFGLPQDWLARVWLSLFISMLVSFGTLAWLKTRVVQAVRKEVTAKAFVQDLAIACAQAEASSASVSNSIDAA